MEILGRLSRAGVLLVVGAMLIASGVVDKFSFASLVVEASRPWQRAVLVVSGILCALASAYLALGRNAAAVHGLRTLVEGDPLSPPPFLFMLDDARPDVVFTSVAKEAAQISVLARTAVHIVGTYRNDLARMLRDGTKIRLLIVDPACPAARHIYGHDTSLYRHHLAQLSMHLRVLLAELERLGGTPQRLSIRMLSEIPPFSMLIVEKRNRPESIIHVQLHFLRTRLSRDRPSFRVAYTDVWYERFLAEFDVLWDTWSTEASVAELSSRTPPEGEA